MKHKNNRALTTVMQLKPREQFGADVDTANPFNTTQNDFVASDIVCDSLEEMSRHLRWLEDDFHSARYEQLAVRAREVVLLADQLGLRRVGQVAADVLYCTEDPQNAALAATLSRLLRLLSQTLEYAAVPVVDF